MDDLPGKGYKSITHNVQNGEAIAPGSHRILNQQIQRTSSAMKTKKLGRTGLKVSEICLGTMTFGGQADLQASHAILDRAAEGGVNFIDTADAYPTPPSLETIGRTEEVIGEWLQGKREQFIVATKCRVETGTRPWNGGLSRKHIIEAVNASLRRLRTEYIDLYQTHSPDPDTPIEETLGALDDLVHSGKIRYIGCSNYGAWRLAKALWTSDIKGLIRFDCVQPRYNLLFRQIEDELLPLCREEGVGVIAYNPLAGGFLTGKYSMSSAPETDTRFGLRSGPTSIYHDRYWHEEQFQAIERLQDILAKQGKTLAQAAVAWLLQQPVITAVILGASRADQLDETLSAVDVKLNEVEMAACDDVWFSLPRRREANIALR